MCWREPSLTRLSRRTRRPLISILKTPKPHLSAGPLLEAQNRYADAEQEYKQAFALDPSSVDALTGMANIYMRGHRFTEAEEILRKLVAMHPTGCRRPHATGADAGRGWPA